MSKTATRRRWFAGLLAGFGVAGLTGLPAGAVSPPGPNGQIAFESGRDGDAEIFAMNPDGTVQRQLTFNKDQDVDPSWSADASRIAFTSDATGNPEIYVMNADGSGVTQLTFAAGEDRGSSWTFDNQKIVFHSARDCPGGVPGPGHTHCLDVYIMNADGTNPVNLTPNTPDSQDSAADVCGDSVNGRIVFNSNRTTPTNPTGDFEIFVMNVDGSNVQQLTFNEVLDSGPVWSPDCSRIAFNEEVAGQLDVLTMNADGSGRTNLTNSPAFDAFAAWSPDGQLIAFSSNRTVDANFDIFTMDATTGGNVTNLTNTPGVGELRAYWGTRAPIPTVGPPTSKAQCKNGGWQSFNNPSFKNEGDCVSFVHH